MKKILAAMLALFVFASSVLGQSDEMRPAAIGVSFFMNDFVTPARIRSTSLSKVISDDQWAKSGELSPGLAISYFKGLHKYVDFAATLGSSFVKYPLADHPFSTERFLMELDATMNFKLVSEKYWVQPLAIAGVGGHMYGGKYFGAYVPLGAGFKINFFDDAHIFANTVYKVPVIKEYTNYHFTYQVGVAGRIGKKAEPVKPLPPAPVDTDKDGITDDVDKCPTIPGLAKYEGCPVPDTDKDGLNDEEDKCPTEAGLARYQGCPIPDTDKDAINDEEDKCPTEAGPASNQGCPVVDTDGDGIVDADDKCPTEAGPASNQGCPEIKKEVVERVNYAAQNIYFATGKTVLLNKSFAGLDEVAKILSENPDVKLSIEGHTDNTGDAKFNQQLSEKRANAVKAYLVKKGVDASRLTSVGYGSSKPVASNKTAAGRQQNRRVELKLSY